MAASPAIGGVAVLDPAVVARRLSTLRLAPQRGHKALTIWPLLAVPETLPDRQGPSFDCIPLGAALEDGMAGVGQPNAAGAHLPVQNRASRPLLVLAGEALGGARAGTRVAKSVLVPARANLEVLLEPSGETRGEMRQDLASWLLALAPLGNQLGFITALGDRVLGIEVLGGPQALAHVYADRLAGHWMRAIELAFRCGPAAPRAPLFDAPEPFLEAVAAAPARVEDVPGLGRTLRLEGRGVLGQALVVAGTLVHLYARPSSSGRRAPLRAVGSAGGPGG